MECLRCSHREVKGPMDDKLSLVVQLGELYLFFQADPGEVGVTLLIGLDGHLVAYGCQADDLSHAPVWGGAGCVLGSDVASAQDNSS